LKLEEEEEEEGGQRKGRVGKGGKGDKKENHLSNVKFYLSVMDPRPSPSIESSIWTKT